MRNKILIGLTTFVTAAAIAGPAQAQIPAPAASGPTLQINDCAVKMSKNGKGYPYASCTVVANNVPFGASVAVQYYANMKTSKPRTLGPWRGKNGTYTLANTGGLPGQVPGTTSTVTGGLKFAFAGKTLSQVRQNLKVVIATTTPGASVIDPIAVPVRAS